MHLRAKIVLILSCVVGVYAVTDHAIQRSTVLRSFIELERKEALHDLERVTAAIDEQVSQLEDLCVIRSKWDATYEFVARRDPGYIESNLGRTSMRKERLNLLIVCDLEGQVVWGDVRDPETFEPIELKRFPTKQLHPSHPLLVGDRDTSPRGVMVTERGPLLACARPILTSEGEGPARGTVIVGRFLGGDVMAEIQNQTGVSFDRWTLGGFGDLPEAERTVVDEVTSSAQPVVRTRDDDTLHVYTEVGDIRSQPSMLVRANVARDISGAGASSVRYALLSTVVAGLLMVFVLIGLIQRTVLGPITKLTDHAVAIGRSDDLSCKVDIERPDEIGILASEFDTMTGKLAASREALVQTARSAGMSEIATGILHNVGNVLNSVNVSAAVVGKQARELGVDELENMANLLADNAEDLARFIVEDPRGKHFMPYLEMVTTNMKSVQGKLFDEVETLSSGIEHIRALINSQQSYAVRSELVEPTSLAGRMEEALSITSQALAVSDEVLVEREFEDLPEVRVDKHKLLEILVNLIQNARQSMAQAGGGAHRLTLRIRTLGEHRVRLEVADNGVGIPPEGLVRVFTLGFTTKKDGHGFGLHAAANAATAMGGTLSAESDGPGCGATFVLELPLMLENGNCMNAMSEEQNRRILLIDDSPAIHEDFKKILLAEDSMSSELDQMRAAFLGASAEAPKQERPRNFELDSALQGAEGYEMVRAALEEGRPYAMAFVDMRMPPGWDGVQTIEKLWEIDDELQVVICTAYSDYSWEETFEKLGRSDRLLILKKPFDPIEISQLASALTEKWSVARRVARLIDDLRGKEQEARSYASSLETLNRALETSKAAAERSAEMKTEFLVHLSNEISAKVGSVIGQVEALREPLSGTNVTMAQLDSIFSSSRYLVATLDDIVDITRLETGQMDFDCFEICPYELADEVAAGFRERAEAKGLGLSIETIGPPPDKLHTDPRRVHQILWNLVDNAIKYTESGSVHIVVGMDLTESWENPQYRFEVRDTGRGIPREKLGYLFEPFQEADPDTDGGLGVGVGLAFSRRMARLLDGDLCVESSDERGSTFLLTLPARTLDQSNLDAA